VRKPHPLPQSMLERLSTQRLLNVLKVARQEEIALWIDGEYPSWRVGFQRGKEHWESQSAYEKRKAEAEQAWNQRKSEADAYLASIRSILATREHVERNT